MAEHAVSVACEAAEDGWRCCVAVGDDPGRTEHDVRVDAETLQRLAPDATPTALVAASFAFLLEREPRTSIMRTFDLPIIGRFFPEYEAEITRRLRRGFARPAQ